MSFNDLMSKARGSMVMDKAFFATLAFRLGIVPGQDGERPATDGVTMSMDPKQAEALPFNQLKAVMAMMAMACGLGHPFRRGHRDEKVWSFVSNCLTGELARAAGFEVPPDWPMHPQITTDTTMEEGYAIIERQSPPQPPENGSEPGEGEGEGSGEGQGEGEGTGDSDQDNGQSDENQDDQDNGQGQGQGQGGADINKPKQRPGGGQGQGQGQGEGDGEGDGQGQDKDHQEQGGDTVSHQEATPEQLRRMEDEWKIAMVQAANAAKRMGDIPGWMKGILDDLNNPQVDWRAVLRRFLEDTCKDDYSFLHPSRRYSGGDVIFPGLHSEGVPRIVFVQDTSCSVQTRERAQFMGELNSMLEEFDMEITVIYCDTEVADVQVYTREDLPIKDQAGGGGTDFRAPFRWVEENMDRPPLALVYCSDMECNRFPEEPPYPVLWVSTANEEQTKRWTGGGVPFGELLYVQVERGY